MKVIKIYYENNETGPAQYLGGRRAKILDHVLFGDELWKGDIVLLDCKPSDADGFPRIEKILSKTYRHVSYVEFDEEEEAMMLMAIFQLLRADSFVMLPPREDGRGVLKVGHNCRIYPEMLAESIGIDQPDDEDNEDEVRIAEPSNN